MLSDRRINVVQFEYGPYNISSRIFLREILEFVRQMKGSLYRLLPRSLLRVEVYTPLLDDFKPAHYVLVLPEFVAALKYAVI